MIILVDFWNTLVTSNPSFKEAKKLAFNEIFKEPEIQEQYFNTIERVKSIANDFAKTYGIQLTYEQIRSIFLASLGFNINNQEAINKLDKYFSTCDSLFSIYPPLEKGTLMQDLNKIKSNLGNKVSIYVVSNTIFSNHSCINDYLYKKQVSREFDYSDLHTSDVLNATKPNVKILHFSLLDKIKKTDTVIVIGDDKDTDGELARNLKARFININNQKEFDEFKENYL